FLSPSTPPTYTLSLHDALPIFRRDPGPGLLCKGDGQWDAARGGLRTGERHANCREADHYNNVRRRGPLARGRDGDDREAARTSRSEEHTSELQSPCNLVCRLLL